MFATGHFRQRQLSPVKLWVFRLLAAALSLLPVVGAEWVLRAWHAGARSEALDPYIGFAAVHPLFVRQDDTYVTDPARLPYFRRDSFAAAKGPQEFRIFCLGGSTVLGSPYSIETAFSTWLELSLRAAAPGHDWQVVNCGGISYASYRLVPILRETLQYDPDLLIIYTGHNEFLEARTYRQVKAMPRLLARIHDWCARLRLYNWLRSIWVARSEPQVANRTVLPAEVDAQLDYRGGLDDYERDELWRSGAVHHFGHNLETMVRLSADAGVPLVLLDPVSNLRDCPPFKSLHDEQLTGQQRAAFDALWAAAASSEKLEERTKLLEEAVRRDDRYAAGLYALAKCYDALRQYDQAHTFYLAAKEEDVCPLRMIEPFHEALRDVARRTRTPLVEARDRFADLSPAGIPGDDWLLDHVHPSVNGHQQIAQWLVEEMVEQGWLVPQAGWQERRQQAYRTHLESLPAAYYVHGQQHLDGLRKWTEGRAPKMR